VCVCVCVCEHVYVLYCLSLPLSPRSVHVPLYVPLLSKHPHTRAYTAHTSSTVRCASESGNSCVQHAHTHTYTRNYAHTHTHTQDLDWEQREVALPVQPQPLAPQAPVTLMQRNRSTPHSDHPPHHTPSSKDSHEAPPAVLMGGAAGGHARVHHPPPAAGACACGCGWVLLGVWEWGCLWGWG